LIAHGHPPDTAWTYTPRQIAAYAAGAQIQETRATARAALATRAAQADKRGFADWMRGLEKDMEAHR
jgi:hypothetical protein